MKLKITVSLMALFTCVLFGAAAGHAEIARLTDATWGGAVGPANSGVTSALNPQGNRLVLEAQSRTQLQNQYWLTTFFEYEGPRGTRSVGTKLISSNPRLLKPGNVRVGTFPRATASLELVAAELLALRQPTTLTLQVIDPGGNRDLTLEIRPYQGP